MNHRFSLGDGILVKDNHVAACGGVAEAVRRARARGNAMLRVEVEVVDLPGLDEAIAAGADIVLLDNMGDEAMAQAVRRAAGRVLLEASGNMTLERLPRVAATGVDFVSMGALTHSARAADISFEIEPAGAPAGGLTVRGPPRRIRAWPRSQRGTRNWSSPSSPRRRTTSSPARPSAASSGSPGPRSGSTSTRSGGRATGSRPSRPAGTGWWPSPTGWAPWRSARSSTRTTWGRRSTAARSSPPRTTGPGSWPTPAAAHGEVVIAESQTAGRGRRGRSWSSPAGRNLYLSVILRPSLPPQRAPELTLVASVAACEACRKAGVETGIKWPNDLLVGGRRWRASSPSSRRRPTPSTGWSWDWA